MKVLIIGSSGFVGCNLYEDLTKHFEVYGCFRSKSIFNQNAIRFDLGAQETWENIILLKPDVIINAAGYGIVKLQQDLRAMFEINYLWPAALFDYIQEQHSCKFIQIGTAFEYDLSLQKLTEESTCRPRSHYGISKFMMSHYLLSSAFANFSIIRPFGMFGPYENENKFFPNLIAAQRDKKKVDLSSGEQVRDFFFREGSFVLSC